ncbi:MAG: hypothetical protein C9356_08355 [Oleiphilus sp.]|nr:MAG: hypothetical protein C9356_08355 [Oleiphilus sp.]
MPNRLPDLKRKFYRNAARAAVLLFGLSVVSLVYAFELLSEGAMDSVSAVSAQSVEDIINVAGNPAAGLTEDDYESLPFQSSVTVEEGDVDEVQTELNFKLTQEVEAWADELRQQGSRQLKVGIVDELPPSSFDNEPLFFQGTRALELAVDEDDDDEEEEALLEEDRIRQRIERLNSGVDSITTRFERFVESAATVNPFPEGNGSTLGSGYISNSLSTSTQTYSNYRDEDRPLF